ncbi:MAG: YebC/PmpR family DNA-binding transcriptional regulator [Candidatus Vogelbacteria bacterium]|nr:YebC/PmpR family DNA-binding transcriptional regulator [Candidatus Vogelbacteria bacterium]
MAGHNKWTQIKRKKGVADAAKSRRFSRLAKQIQWEARKAGGDHNTAGLKAAIARAREANMPSDNIERAIKAATLAGANLEAVLYEAYGPGGAALIIEAMTDNKNRTAQEIKHLLAAHGAALASPGAALWAFEQTPDGLRPGASGPAGYRPKNPRRVTGEERTRLNELSAALEKHEDVQNLWHDAAADPTDENSGH